MNRQCSQVPDLSPASAASNPLAPTSSSPETSPNTDRSALYASFQQFSPAAYPPETLYSTKPVIPGHVYFPPASIPSIPPPIVQPSLAFTSAPTGQPAMPTNSLSSLVTMRPTPPAASTSKQEQAGQNGSHDDLRDTSSSAGSPYGDGPGMVNCSASRHDRKKNTKQRRNKPTLSCFECVERKTKCDRGRPTCFACIRRGSFCAYDRVAQILEESHRTSANGPRMTRPSSKRLSQSKYSIIPNMADHSLIGSKSSTSQGAVALSTGLMSNMPFSVSSGSNVFGIGAQHPFANYWTCKGGLPEVISVIPTKAQTDALMARYFECVDPVYPMIHRQTFYADYEHFWGMADVDRSHVDASFVALLFVMIAMGAQFVEDYPCAEKKNMAEFYASASHQSLRVYSYLSTASVTSIQAMVLITYFLINDNHVTDGWAFAGILTRQSYAMGLHRDPNIVTPNASLLEKQQRRKLWQAVLLQDTFLTILLSLPPTATHTDVTVDSLIEDGSSIANSDPTDTLYIKCSWTLANLVQESICSPRSLDLPICTTARHKTKLINEFKSVYRSFPDLFRCCDKATLTARTATEGRAVRQILWLTSNFFHNLMLVNASMSDEVSVNVRGTLEAAHDAIMSFFLLFELFESEARMWWAFNHRAFLEALCIGAVLKMHAGDRENIDETIYDRGKNDLLRMVEIMHRMGERGSELARTRAAVLNEYLADLKGST
ncbi:hypothetical protein Cpir12675_001377 [Ceratocystis pirilliformis]|uniref:Zn(2)-C6 fungal-type domain-containing protein n=1 Tax=Ceratocystis pirilliformis TaxID=259994 RepID=A0ABR3ZIG0_9PEZI